jgi:hypothetical protein
MIQFLIYGICIIAAIVGIIWYVRDIIRSMEEEEVEGYHRI